MRRFRGLALAVCLVATLIAPPGAWADHPGRTGWPGPPDEDVRLHPPNDPRFDRAEPPHDSFPLGCKPTSSPAAERPVLDCPTIFDEQYEWFGFAPEYTKTSAFNRDGTPQIAGASIDRAWQVTTGHPGAVIAIVDTGVRWERTELDTKVYLNAGELPGARDANGDGVLNVMDYCPDATSAFACPSAASSVADTNGNGRLDGQDIIRAFSDGVDDDQNGYVDDISGWDFFDDDNDPEDASSHGSANNHGSGRAEEAGAETNNGEGGVGACPRCPLMFLRVWDTFIPPVDNWAQAQVYAADQGAVATENAVGTLGANAFGADATRYAWDRGTLPVVVSSDLNTAHHDYPANYANILWVNGVVADLESSDGGVQPRTYFRQANLTQYGGHAQVAIGGDTGSQATGKAAGVAGLVASRGMELVAQGFLSSPPSAAEIKQTIAMTADDVDLPETLGYGVPDHAQPGWDEHFGYGRINARRAVDALGDPARGLPARIPPEVFISSPDWWTLADPHARMLTVEGHVAAPRTAGRFTYEVAIGRGIEPESFTVVAHRRTAGTDGALARIPGARLRALFPPLTDFTRPPLHPNEFVFTVRVRALAGGVVGEDRRQYFLHRDSALAPGWPKYLGHGPESSPKLSDLDRDGRLDILVPTTNGELHAFRVDGSEIFRFTSDPSALMTAHASSPGISALGVRPVGLLTPAVGDVDGDGVDELVVADGSGLLYVLAPDGSRERSWLAIDAARSAPALRTKENAVATGVIGAPVLADLDADPQLEVVVAALDGHVYVWNHDATPVPGFPVLLQDPEGTFRTDPKIITTPAVGDITGDGRPEIVAGTNEYREAIGPSAVAERLADRISSVEKAIGAPGALGGAAADALNSVGVSSRIYAVHADGTYAPGWPVSLDGLLADALPLIGPGITPALADLDGDGTAEVLTGVATSNLFAFSGDGSVLKEFASSSFGAASDAVDRSVALSLFEYPAVGDLNGDGRPEIVRGGITLNAAVNLLLVGQNLPFDHVVQAWDARTGAYLPSFPRRVEDWMLLHNPAVADVGGIGPGAEAVVGTGLYLLHAFGATGLEPLGWPKLTGGWTIATPAVGDLDGDGKVEVVGVTREGWVHVWRTDGSSAENDEWWSFHHDEWNSGLYGFDPRRRNEE